MFAAVWLLGAAFSGSLGAAALDVRGTYLLRLCRDADAEAVTAALQREFRLEHDRGKAWRREEDGGTRLARNVHASLGRGGRRTLVVGGVEPEEAARLQGVRGVCSVSEDRPIRKSAYNWGVDRIMNKDGLDGKYSTPLSIPGAGASIFVVDTGLDTTHCEFDESDDYPARTVANVLNQWGAVKEDTDGDGHGTHVASIAGGRTVGVASGADIYGVKTLDNDGNGRVSLLVEAVDWIIEWHLAQEAPRRTTIINLSLESDIACVAASATRDDPCVRESERRTKGPERSRRTSAAGAGARATARTIASTGRWRTPSRRAFSRSSPRATRTRARATTRRRRPARSTA